LGIFNITGRVEEWKVRGIREFFQLSKNKGNKVTP
jgi:hypothetical protein